MATKGPIIIIEDDLDDQEILANAIQNTGRQNEIVVFGEATLALKYLIETTNQPFLIFCDINLPKISGLEFRQQLLNNSLLRERGTPFIFLTTSERKDFIREAFTLMVQGYFVKQNSYDELVIDMETIFNYWDSSKHP